MTKLGKNLPSRALSLDAEHEGRTLHGAVGEHDRGMHDVEVGHDAESERERLRDLLRRVTDAERAVLERRYFAAAGRMPSLEDVAAGLGVGRGVVRGAEHRGLQQLGRITGRSSEQLAEALSAGLVSPREAIEHRPGGLTILRALGKLPPEMAEQWPEPRKPQRRAPKAPLPKGVAPAVTKAAMEQLGAIASALGAAQRAQRDAGRHLVEVAKLVERLTAELTKRM